MKNVFKTLGIIVFVAVIGFGMACKDPGSNGSSPGSQTCECNNPCTTANCECEDCPGPGFGDPTCECNTPCTIATCPCPDCPGQIELLIPLASHYSFGSLTQTAGAVTAVTVTRISGSTGEVSNIQYEGTGGTNYAKSALIPQTAGTYAVTFDVAAVTGWNAATLSAGNLTVSLITFADNAFNVTGETYQVIGEVTAVSVTWSRSETITVSYRGIDGTNYPKNTAVPQAIGHYEVIIDIAAVPGYFAAISRRVFTFVVTAEPIERENITFNISWTQISDLAADIISNVSIYKIASEGKPSTGAFTLPGVAADYDSIQWYVNGVLDTSKNGSLTYPVNAADYPVDTNSVTVRMVIDGNTYNKTVYFTVTMF